MKPKEVQYIGRKGREEATRRRRRGEIGKKYREEGMEGTKERGRTAQKEMDKRW